MNQSLTHSLAVLSLSESESDSFSSCFELSELIHSNLSQLKYHSTTCAVCTCVSASVHCFTLCRPVHSKQNYISTILLHTVFWLIIFIVGKVAHYYARIPYTFIKRSPQFQAHAVAQLCIILPSVPQIPVGIVPYCIP